MQKFFSLVLAGVMGLGLALAQTRSAGEVTGLTLYNADTDVAIGDLQDGTVIDFSALGTKNISVVATTDPAEVGSVRFSLDEQVVATESAAPYAVAGDSDGGRNFNPWTVLPGRHTLTVTPYSGSGAAGEAGIPLTVAFTVLDETSTPIATPEVQDDTALDEVSTPTVTPEAQDDTVLDESATLITTPEVQDMPRELGAVPAASVQRSRFSISSVGGRGVDGSILISDYGFNGAVVVILVRGVQPSESYPAHLHGGNCGSGGDIVAPLEEVGGKSGLSVTLTDVPYDEMVEQDLYVDLHPSDTDLATLVACGEVGARN